jgi:hypothetical protein
VGLHSIPIIIILFERAYQDGEHDAVLFLIKLVFIIYTGTYIQKTPFLESFLRPSTCHLFFQIKTKNLEKMATSCPAF